MFVAPRVKVKLERATAAFRVKGFAVNQLHEVNREGN